MIEDQRADHAIKGSVSKGKRARDIVHDEARHAAPGCLREHRSLAGGPRVSLDPGLRKHSFGEVDPGHPRPSARKTQRMPSGPAAYVENRETRDRPQELGHDRLLEQNQRIGALVVSRRPKIIALLS